jgi:hypothetical protein
MTLHTSITVFIAESTNVRIHPTPASARSGGGQLPDTISVLLQEGAEVIALTFRDRTAVQALYFSLGDALNWFDDQAGTQPSFNDQPPPVGARSWEDIEFPEPPPKLVIPDLED